MGNGSLWVAAALGRFDAGPPLPPGGHQGSPWFEPRGPFPPVHPEYSVGLGTARRQHRVEAGAVAHARLHPRLTATRALGAVDGRARRRGRLRQQRPSVQGGGRARVGPEGQITG